MPNKIVIRHRAPGGAGPGAPPTTGAITGEIALNLDTGAGTAEAWAFDGTNWRRLNPAAAAPTVGNVALPGGTSGSSAGIGAAWTAFNPKPTDPIVIASFAGTAYVRTGAGGADGDWTSLGSAASFATQAEVNAGTRTDAGIAPDTLRGTTLNAPTATPANDADRLPRLGTGGRLDAGFIPNASAAEALAGLLDTVFMTPADVRSITLTAPSAAGAVVAADANRLVRLNANGKIDAGFLTIGGLKIRGGTDPTAGGPPALTLPDAYASGDVYFVTGAGGGATGNWPGIPNGTVLATGDTLIFDGTNWHAIQANLDPNAFLRLTGTSAGHTMTDTAAITFAVPAGAGLVARLDGTDAAKSEITNFTVSGGTF